MQSQTSVGTAPAQRMKYPDTRQMPSASSMGVTVSTAEALFANTVSYRMVTYFPSGAPGAFSLYRRDITLRETTFPSGGRTPARACVHCSFVTALLNGLAA